MTARASRRFGLDDLRSAPPDTRWTGWTCAVAAGALSCAGVIGLGGFLAGYSSLAVIALVVVLSFGGPVLLRRYFAVPVWRWVAHGARLGGIIGILALPLVILT